jgi:hypothetical protein
MWELTIEGRGGEGKTRVENRHNKKRESLALLQNSIAQSQSSRSLPLIPLIPIFLVARLFLFFFFLWCLDLFSFPLLSSVRAFYNFVNRSSLLISLMLDLFSFSPPFLLWLSLRLEFRAVRIDFREGRVNKENALSFVKSVLRFGLRAAAEIFSDLLIAKRTFFCVFFPLLFLPLLLALLFALSCRVVRTHFPLSFVSFRL